MDYDVEDKMEWTVIFIMEFGRRHDLNMKQALSVVLNSDTCKNVMDEHARLYYQSPGYVFSSLESELNTGKMR